MTDFKISIKYCSRITANIILTSTLIGLTSSASADSVSFEELANKGIGLESYKRRPSERFQLWLDRLEGSEESPIIPFVDIPILPNTPHGLPGVVIFDYDNDGDNDIFVTNGPGTSNSLFQNQLVESHGKLSFIDVAKSAGVDNPATDTSGACYADIDNDGDADLVTIANESAHRVFENMGDGSFDDISESSGLSATGGFGATGCSFGDVDLDGLVDLYIAHTWDQNSNIDCFSTTPFLDQPNELYLNRGENNFVDASEKSGIRNLGGLSQALEGINGNTWSAALVDYDSDGDIDVINADDQCLFPPEPEGLDRGFIQIWDNDGYGNFKNTTVVNQTNVPSAWLGLTFGDYDFDGNIDIYAASEGGHFLPSSRLPAPDIPFYDETQLFLGSNNGTFSRPGIGERVTTPFAWGITTQDWDNDGDLDIGNYGSLHTILRKNTTNNGTILLNDGLGNFDRASDALQTQHRFRTVHGVAGGDLDNDGKTDIVTVSSADSQPNLPFVSFTEQGIDLGSSFEETAGFISRMSFTPLQDGTPAFTWIGELFVEGGISVERNTSSNQNNWLKVTTLGSIGLTEKGSVNRMGIGAILKVTPRKSSKTAILPVTGGSSHLSQDAHTRNFGLGISKSATVEIIWPGGVKNKLYNVPAGSELTFPEIPCSFTSDLDFSSYETCVISSLKELRGQGVINKREFSRLFSSAIRAYSEEKLK